MKMYLELEFGSGRLYEYSKTEKDDFEKYVSQTNKISYRKYYAYGVFGVLQSISRRKNTFGEFLSLYLIDKDKNSVYVKIPMYNQGGDFTPYTDSLLAQIAELQIQTGYKVQPYAIEKEGTKYKTYGISFKEADVLEEAVYEDVDPITKLSFSYYKKEGNKNVLVEGDIPAVEWTDKRGKWVANTEAKTDYLYEVMMAHTVDASEAGSGSGIKTAKKYGDSEPAVETDTKETPPTKKATAKKPSTVKVEYTEAEVEVEGEDEDDDLPF